MHALSHASALYPANFEAYYHWVKDRQLKDFLADREKCLLLAKAVRDLMDQAGKVPHETLSGTRFLTDQMKLAVETRFGLNDLAIRSVQATAKFLNLGHETVKVRLLNARRNLYPFFSQGKALNELGLKVRLF